MRTTAGIANKYMKTIKLFNGEIEINSEVNPNMYKTTIEMGLYEMECYLSDTAQKMFYLQEYPTTEQINKVIDLIEKGKIVSDYSA